MCVPSTCTHITHDVYECTRGTGAWAYIPRTRKVSSCYAERSNTRPGQRAARYSAQNACAARQSASRRARSAARRRRRASGSLAPMLAQLSPAPRRAGGASVESGARDAAGGGMRARAVGSARLLFARESERQSAGRASVEAAGPHATGPACTVRALAFCPRKRGPICTPGVLHGYVFILKQKKCKRCPQPCSQR